jgi:hypothetical protein
VEVHRLTLVNLKTFGWEVSTWYLNREVGYCYRVKGEIIIGSRFLYHLDLTSFLRSRSTDHEIHRIVWNPKLYYHVHKSTSLEHIPRKLNLVRLIKIHFNIIVPPMLRSPKWPSPFKFPDYSLCISQKADLFWMSHPFHFPWFFTLNSRAIINLSRNPLLHGVNLSLINKLLT